MCINNKNIYIVEEHHHVLKAWEQYQGANVITFDYHTDTHEAFLQEASKNSFGELPLNRDEISSSERKNNQRKFFLEYDRNRNIDDIISKLKSDEHLSFAVQSGIIDFVYVCSHDRGNNYQYYENIFNIDNYIWCQRKKKQ